MSDTPDTDETRRFKVCPACRGSGTDRARERCPGCGGEGGEYRDPVPELNEDGRKERI